MFKTNEGSVDRVLRVLIGIALIAGYFLNPEGTYRWAYLLGIIPLVTGLVGFCPLYTLLGINTCGLKKS